MAKKEWNPKRTIIVGDVHGCFTEFTNLIKKIQYNEEEDQLILVGDVINKGPQSYQMLEWLMMNPMVICLRGNHESAFIDYARNPQKYYQNETFEALIKELGKDLKNAVRWLDDLPLYYEDDEMIVVHAGIRPGKDMDKQELKILTTIRTWDGRGEDLKNPNNPAWFDFYQGEKIIVFGHWAALGLMVKPNLVCLDSGCVYGNQLSAFVYPEKKIVQVDALDTYQKLNTH